MSGEGAAPAMSLHGIRFEAGMARERGDILAYLRRRQMNALTMAENAKGDSEAQDLATDRARQMGIIIQEIETGLHAGEAEVAAARATAQETT